MCTLSLQKIFSLVFVLIFILTACQTETPTASPLSATLKELTGTVNIKQAGGTDFVKAAGNETLDENGSVQTAGNGRVRLDLSTGTIIRLSPSSLFTLASNQQSGSGLSTKLKLDLGRIFVILKGGSMDVQTPSGVASVRGSYLMVEVDPNTLDVYVTCLEGHCGANNDAGGVDFGSGEKTVLFHRDSVTGQYTVPQVGPMTPEDFQKWLDENPEAQDVLNQAYATMTALASTEAPATEAPTEAPVEPSPTATNTPTPIGCAIIGPLGGSDLPKYGLVTFAWNAQPGATKYIVTFHYLNGGGGTFETTDANIQRDMGTIKSGGTYSWDVQAVDGSGNQLCHSESVSFSKPKYGADNPTPKPECDTSNAQADNPNAPCYCALNSNQSLPPWCSNFGF